MSSVVGIGIDIVRISRIARLLAENKSKARFLRRVLHPSELEVFSNLGQEKGAQYVAGSWAAKEAAYKTLDTDDQMMFQFKDWYKYSRERRPFIGRDGLNPKEEFHLSISHDGDILVATVLRQRLNEAFNREHK